MSLEYVTLQEETVAPQSNDHAGTDPAIYRQRTNNVAPSPQRLRKMLSMMPAPSSPYSPHRRSALTAAFHEAVLVKLTSKSL